MKGIRLPKHSYAFIDGSFNPVTKVYGCGGFLVDQIGKKHILRASGNEPAMAVMRNVAGEILGAREAVKLALQLGMKELVIFHDYEGIANWVLGKWRARKKATRDYAAFMKAAIASGLALYFRHVRGHSGVDGNEEADRLAKMAVGIFREAA